MCIKLDTLGQCAEVICRAWAPSFRILSIRQIHQPGAYTCEDWLPPPAALPVKSLLSFFLPLCLPALSHLKFLLTSRGRKKSQLLRIIKRQLKWAGIFMTQTGRLLHCISPLTCPKSVHFLFSTCSCPAFVCAQSEKLASFTSCLDYTHTPSGQDNACLISQ